MARPIRQSDEGRLIVTEADNGEDHFAILVKYNELPGFSRVKFLNKFGDRPTEESRVHHG